MGSDAQARMKLRGVADQGLVAVRYTNKCANVELEVLDDCFVPNLKYEYSPSWSETGTDGSTTGKIYAELPLVTANLKGRIKGTHIVKGSQKGGGFWQLRPPSRVVLASELVGRSCSRATHIVTTIYVGGFALVDADARQVSASTDVIVAKVGADHESRWEHLDSDGDPEACERVRTTQKSDPMCNVPLRLSLQSVERGGTTVCAEGSKWSGSQCVRSAPIASTTPAAPAVLPEPTATPSSSGDAKQAAADMVRFPGGTAPFANALPAWLSPCLGHVGKRFGMDCQHLLRIIRPRREVHR